MVAPYLPKAAKVLFISNAADKYDDAWWVEDDRKALQGQGYEVIDTDLRSISKDELASQLESVQVLHVNGGSVLYLIDLMRKQGMIDVIIDFVRNRNLIYTATSAGSIIAAPSVELYKYEKEEQEHAPNIADYTGLNLINFLIMPHCNQKEFAENNQLMVSHMPEYALPIIMLYDNQVVKVIDEKIDILTNS